MAIQQSNITYDLSNPDLFNHQYLPLLYDDKRFKILYGGRDSGKSDFIAQVLIIRALVEEFCRILLIRRYFAHIKKSQFQTIVDYICLWKLQDEFHITNNPLKITCRRNGNQMIAIGLDTVDNVKSTKDPTIAWYEEANQISANAFRTASSSIRSSRTRRLEEWISFNPNDESTHFNSHFFPDKHSYEKADGSHLWVPSKHPNATILHTNYTANRFCSPARREELESYKDIDYNYYKINTLGLWGGGLRGLVYPKWNIVDEFPTGGDEVIGIDYGYNNPSAVVLVSYYEGELYVKQLAYVYENTASDIVKIMISLGEQFRKKLIIADCAAADLIASLKRAGFRVKPSDKGPNSVYNGIIQVKSYNLNVTVDSEEVIRELNSYIWKEDKEERTLDEPVKLNDHSLDAIRYIVQTYGRIYWQKAKSATSAKPIARPARSRRNNHYSFN